MRGLDVFYPFGLDNNGLPTELLIEKKFNTTAEHLGRDKFIALVQKEIKPYVANYIEIFKSLGVSADWNLLYETVSPDTQKISQKSFLELCRMNRTYRKEAPVLYCPHCKTTVSQMELEDKSVKSKIVYVRFSEDVEIATTRAEFLPACVAIFVNPADEKHKHLIGKKVKVPIFGQEVEVLGDAKVDPAFGTGVVMCCTFGDQTDMEWYKQYNLPLRMILDDSGRMTHEFFKGEKVKEAREKVISALKDGGFVIKEEDIEHNVNVHERCKTEIELIVKKQWYIKYLDLKEKFIELGNQVKWHPEFMHVRYDNWVNGLKWDWSISRQRFFGVPFPVWYCKNCGEPKFAREEDLPVNPMSDAPKGTCGKCGHGDFVPETDVLDTWATSSLTPLINARWGLDGKYLGTIFPMSLRVQANEIISFWTFTTIVKSYFHMDSIPWSDIMISGQGLDSKGKPMHKSAGNVVAPMPFVEKYGADAVRYWASSSSLGEDSSFQEKEIVTGASTINKMWNVARFISMACADKTEAPSDNPIDYWISCKLSTAVLKATESFERFDYFKARVAAEELFWSFSNDYIEFVKYRVYNKDPSANRTINGTLLSILKMFAPFMPFATEEIYKNVFAGNANIPAEDAGAMSIHVSAWPVGNKFDEEKFRKSDDAIKTILFIRKWKHDNAMALNAELSEVTISVDLGPAEKDVMGAMNIKKITKGEGDLQVPETSPEIKLSIKK
ncbi:Isoleucine--tRNA ligase [uncultured archaeon]|nr:Isoleucine--tRNA ligase [uncultured archaeon]